MLLIGWGRVALLWLPHKVTFYGNTVSLKQKADRKRERAKIPFSADRISYFTEHSNLLHPVYYSENWATINLFLDLVSRLTDRESV